MEAGETPEHAVTREVVEELGLAARKTQYITARPGPFSYALMLGYITHVADCQVPCLSDELEEAIWFDRFEVSAAIRSSGNGAPLLPPPGVTGRALIEHWLAIDTEANGIVI